MAVRYVQRLRKLNPTIALYFVTIALVGFAIDGGVYAVLLNLFLLRLEYGTEAIGLINAAGTLTFALSSLPAGLLGERWGSRRMILIGLSLLLVGSALLPFADVVAAEWQLAWLLAADVVLYMGLSLYFVNTAPFIMAAVEAGQRNRIFSIQTALLSLSAFVGSLVGGFLPAIIAALLGMSAEQPAPYRYALVIAGASLVVAVLAIRATPQTSARREEAVARRHGAAAGGHGDRRADGHDRAGAAAPGGGHGGHHDVLQRLPRPGAAGAHRADRRDRGGRAAAGRPGRVCHGVADCAVWQSRGGDRRIAGHGDQHPAPAR